MATKDTVDLGPAHEPKEESIKSYNQFEAELKKELISLRHKHDKHEPEYFAAAKNLSDADLASFSSKDFTQVRVALSAYGVILFGKLRIPALDNGFLHFRAWSAGPDDEAKFHSFHTEEKDVGGDKTFRAIFPADEELEWFDS